MFRWLPSYILLQVFDAATQEQFAMQGVHHAGPERGNVAVVVVICPNQYSVTFSQESRLPLHDGCVS